MENELVFVIKGQTYYLNKFEARLDAAFVLLYQAYIDGVMFNWNAFFTAAYRYFVSEAAREKKVSPAICNKYFNNFIYLWSNFINASKYDDALKIWELALTPVLNFEEDFKDTHFHKGQCYSYLGNTYILSGDIDRGYLYLHQAVVEDRETFGVVTPDTQAYKIVSLNHQGAERLNEWIIDQETYLDDEFIEVFNARFKQKLTLEVFQRKFLQNPNNVDSVFLFSYTLASLMHLDRTKEHALKNDFAGTLQTSLLFNISLVIEQSMRSKYPKIDRYKDLLIKVARSARMPFHMDLNKVNKPFQTNFEDTLSLLIANKSPVEPGKMISEVDKWVAVTYGIRNYFAHTTKTQRIIWENFDEIKRCVMYTLFLVVLYGM